MTWQLFHGTEQEWDDIVVRLGATTPFQLSAWARFRQSFGWHSIRLLTSEGTAAVQMLVKPVGPARIAWAPGAPLGCVSTELLRELAREVKRFVGGAVVYLRLADHHSLDQSRVESFKLAGWSPCSTSLGGTATLVRSLNQTSQPVNDSYSGNWSRNLRRGTQRGITATAWDTPDSVLVASMHGDVEDIKEAFHAEWRSDSGAIRHLLEAFGERLVMVRAQDATGTIHSVRAAVVVGANAFDFLAATSKDGRKLYASNVALDALLTILASRGVTTYDFGGVDRMNNKGVFDFKHGAGGRELSYTGDFEAAAPRLAKPVISKLMSLRLSA
jgi:hypothetical protein